MKTPLSLPKIDSHKNMVMFVITRAIIAVGGLLILQVDFIKN